MHTIDATPMQTIDATLAATVTANATPSPTATCNAWTLLHRDTDFDSLVDIWKCSAGLQVYVAPELPFGFERFRQLFLSHLATAQAVMAELDSGMRQLIACWVVAAVAIVVLVVVRKAVVAYTSREERPESFDLTIPGMNISYELVSVQCGYVIRFANADLFLVIARIRSAVPHPLH